MNEEVKNMCDLSSFAMPFLEGDVDHANKDSLRKGDLGCRSASPTKAFFSRVPFNRPSSPMSAPARTRNSPGSPKPIFPYSSSHEASPKCSRRRSFTGIFRSSSKDSTSSSTSPVSIKLFSRARKGKLKLIRGLETTEQIQDIVFHCSLCVRNEHFCTTFTPMKRFSSLRGTKKRKEQEGRMGRRKSEPHGLLGTSKISFQTTVAVLF
ncbi:hypothetical protein DNTS_007140 [Danionella cerebrum]|uniref:Uncharacterized protein n=1 Tax=Danionella cerebrum TaxID=2873325 RepID=A0A553NAM8_9TELE|nr:hypothetical protein DNTS_007140 [Danionella translucida]